nr:di-heme oxidoredictase family protein [uncultured Desulfobacter sp.]
MKMNINNEGFSKKVHKKKIKTMLWGLGLLGSAGIFICVLTSGAWAHIAVGGDPPDVSEEYYTGGRMGTVFVTTTRCLEMPSPAINADPELSEKFGAGESIFEADFVTDPDAPFGGLGPVYNNSSCQNCHPNYARARRVSKFKTEQWGNGYLVLIHKDGKLINGFKFMAQTMATPPYQPPAQDIKISWKNYTDQYGNKYPDGTPYNEGKPYEGTLIYPVTEVVGSLFPLPEGTRADLEGTIGIFGAGLLDVIPDEDIIEEYNRQQALPGPIKGQHGRWIVEPHDGEKHLGKFTTHCTRATLQNGPGFNGAWSVANLTRTDKPALFATQEWIDKQGELGFDTALLSAHQPVEVSDEDRDSLMIWMRGLGVPAARNLNDPMVQRGKQKFYEIGCNECHKPSWTTGTKSPYIPAYANQKIWPYTDLLMHDMGEMNHGFRKTFRTMPLWARQMIHTVADHTDMWHDQRARDFEGAILWHFGEGEESREAFRKLSKKDREAVIKFLRAI